MLFYWFDDDDSHHRNVMIDDWRMDRMKIKRDGLIVVHGVNSVCIILFSRMYLELWRHGT